MITKLSPIKHLPLKFGKKKGKELLTNFNGGQITSNAGIVWLAELDKKLKIATTYLGLLYQQNPPWIKC